MLPADMAMGGVSAAAAADLKVGAGVLQTFKQRVDKLLAEFEGSAGSAAKVGGHQIPRTALSGVGEFHEADGLHTQYDQVHRQITHLSKMLSLQIEAMGIAAHGAEIGFDNLEEDQRRRYWAIQVRIDREHDAAEQKKSGEPAPERSDAKKSTKGFQ
ncbi:MULTISPECIES: hypothetical protein [unclassified Streptomyces]|uniref:Uncharacterized protein n=1 Tax=Streptomyces sp. NBC_00119 TaxID=2975659 RepID=A0AAU1U7C2_9ACTN|nr:MULTISPECIES: hypothetical protein [unclassified Streptomyces]MCX4642795.1 hypothetical protein [Streptomyces sp. NBC_01446]MCX5323920.1 hypothetical protein [Streptomyces sp. NBC_00120]